MRSCSCVRISNKQKINVKTSTSLGHGLPSPMLFKLCRKFLFNICNRRGSASLETQKPKVSIGFPSPPSYPKTVHFEGMPSSLSRVLHLVKKSSLSFLFEMPQCSLLDRTDMGKSSVTIKTA